MHSTQAAAKLNLFLHITGKRADGFHFLQSLAIFLNAGDRLEAEFAPDISLEIAGEFGSVLQTEPDNLVLKAAHLLRDASGCNKGARIHLYKELPVGAGLGGGSADAAAAIRLLMALWEVPVSNETLQKIAAKLGSDVHACLVSSPCFIEGTGERITPVSLRDDLAIVLVNPRKLLLTADVYKAYKSAYGVEISLPFQLSAQSLHALLMNTRNDLEEPAIRLMPEIGDILESIRKEGALCARMSGSGATCFGIFENQEKADRAAGHLRASRSSWWVVSARLAGKTFIQVDS